MQLNKINWSELDANTRKSAREYRQAIDIQTLANMLGTSAGVAENTMEAVQHWTINQVAHQLRNGIKREALISHFQSTRFDPTSQSVINQLYSPKGEKLFGLLIDSDDNPIETLGVITKASEDVVQKCLFANVEGTLSAVGRELQRQQQGNDFLEHHEKSHETINDDDLDQLFGKPGHSGISPISSDTSTSKTDTNPGSKHYGLKPLGEDLDEKTLGSTPIKPLDFIDSDDEDLVLDGSSDGRAREERHRIYANEGNTSKGLRNIAIIGLAALVIAALIAPKITGRSIGSYIGLSDNRDDSIRKATDTSAPENYHAGSDITIEGLENTPNDRVDPMAEDWTQFAREARAIRSKMEEAYYEKNPDKRPIALVLGRDEITRLDLETFNIIPASSWSDGGIN